eukprot:gene11131-19711_t
MYLRTAEAVFHKACLDRTCKKCQIENLKPCSKERALKTSFTVMEFQLDKGTGNYVRKYVSLSVDAVYERLRNRINVWASHRHAVRHQRKENRRLLDTLGTHEAVLYMDYAESYRCVPYGEISAEYMKGAEVSML